MAHLERQLQFYTEAARRLGNDGSRVSRRRAGRAGIGGPGGQGCQGLPTDHLLAPQEAAKEALYRRNLVESEVRGLGIGDGVGSCGHVPNPDPGGLSPQLQRLRR